MRRRRRTGRIARWASWWIAWSPTIMIVGLMVVAGAWLVWPTPPAPVTSGTIVGFRFSGKFPHRCRIWIKPTGATIDDRVLLDPNTELECLNARIGDRWERAR